MAPASAMTRDPIIIETTGNLVPTLDTDPLEVRWGFNPVQRDKILNPRECNYYRVPFSRFFLIKTFYTPQENHTTDENKPKEIMTAVTAADAEKSLMDALGGKNAQIQTNWGMQVGFLGMRDEGKMAVINRALLPNLTTIIEICENFNLPLPISRVCEGEDESDFHGRETCVTCWYKWLTSDSCAAYCEQVSEIGINITESSRETAQLIERLVRPTVLELETARNLIIEAYRIGIPTLQKQWREIAESEEKGERKPANEFENSYRKDLHADKPADRQITLVERLARASNQGGAGNAEVINQLVALQIQNQQMLNVMMANQQQPAPVFQSEPVSDPVLNETENFGIKMAKIRQEKKEQRENDTTTSN